PGDHPYRAGRARHARRPDPRPPGQPTGPDHRGRAPEHLRTARIRLVLRRRSGLGDDLRSGGHRLDRRGAAPAAPPSDAHRPSMITHSVTTASVSLRGVGRMFGATTALAGVDLDLGPGVIGLLG